MKIVCRCDNTKHAISPSYAVKAIAFFSFLLIVGAFNIADARDDGGFAIYLPREKVSLERGAHRGTFFTFFTCISFPHLIESSHASSRPLGCAGNTSSCHGARHRWD